MINTLRDNKAKSTAENPDGLNTIGNFKAEEDGDKDEDKNMKPPETVPIPPSFYQADLERW